MSAKNNQPAHGLRILIAGIGNTDRGDDAVGPLVARSIAGRLPPGARAIVNRGDMFELIEDWKTADAVICVDAAMSSGAPGCIHRFDANAEPIPRELSLVSSHIFGLADAIELARALGMLPEILIVLAVEADNFQTGSEMAPEILSAAEAVEELILNEIKALQASRRSREPVG